MGCFCFSFNGFMTIKIPNMCVERMLWWHTHDIIDHFLVPAPINTYMERSRVEFLTGDKEVVVWSLTAVPSLCHCERHNNP